MIELVACSRGIRSVHGRGYFPAFRMIFIGIAWLIYSHTSAVTAQHLHRGGLLLNGGGFGDDLLIPVAEEEHHHYWGQRLFHCAQSELQEPRTSRKLVPPCVHPYFSRTKVPLPEPKVITYEDTLKNRSTRREQDDTSQSSDGAKNDPRDFSIYLTVESRRVSYFNGHRKLKQLRDDVGSDLKHVMDSPLTGGFDGNATDAWTFNGTVPGPTIRAKVGDVLRITLKNTLAVPTGFFIPGVFNARDPLEGGFVKPGSTATLAVPLSEAGTFLYRSPIEPAHQVPMGLYGAIIVEDSTEETPVFEDHVIVMSDPLIGHRSYQVLPPLEDPLKRAEEQYNGRRGNVLLMNGDSISAGHELVVNAPTLLRLHIINACNSRVLGLRFEGFLVQITTSAGTKALYAGDENEYLQHTKKFLRNRQDMPPGSTATLLAAITKENASSDELSLYLFDATDARERKRAELRLRSEQRSPSLSEMRVSPVVAETWSPSLEHPKKRLLELLLVPSKDGLAYTEGSLFQDIELLPRVPLSAAVTDVAFLVSSATTEMPTWAFSKDVFVGNTTEVNLLVELLCPNAVEIPRITVSLFAGIAPSKEEIPLDVTHAVCRVNTPEVPLDFRSQKLTDYFKLEIGEAANQSTDKNNNSSETFIWLRAKVEFDDPTGSKVIYLASAKGSIIPPPTLRVLSLVDKQTKSPTALGLPQTPEAIRARRRRIERVFHELQHEQQDLKIHLKKLYDRLQRHDLRIHSSNSFVGLDREQDRHEKADAFVADLESHLKQQEQQRDVEKRIIAVRKSDLPEQEKQEVLRDLQLQLHQQILQQEQHHKALREKLSALSQDSGAINFVRASERRLDAVGQVRSGLHINRENALVVPITGGSAELDPHHHARFRGGGYDEGYPTLEVVTLQHQRQQYMKLYHQYSQVVEDLRHLRDAAQALRFAAPDQDPHNSEYYEYTVPDPNTPLARSEPEELLLRIRADKILNVKNPPQLPDVHLRLQLASFLQLASKDGVHFTWVNGTTLRPLPVVEVTVNQGVEANALGNFPMWIVANLYMPDGEPLRAGDVVLWLFKNPTPLTHVLYAHRAKFEIAATEKVWPDGAREESPVESVDPMNGAISFLTLPPSPGPGGFCLVRALSIVPRIYLSLQGQRAINTTSLARWDVKIQSAILEHLANGLSARVHFAVHAEQPNPAVPGGMDFSNSGIFEEPAPHSRTMTLVASAGGLMVVGCAAAAVAMRRGYHNRLQKQFGRRHSGDEDVLDGGSPVTTPQMYDSHYSHATARSYDRAISSATFTTSPGVSENTVGQFGAATRPGDFTTPSGRSNTPAAAAAADTVAAFSADRLRRVKYRPPAGGNLNTPSTRRSSFQRLHTTPFPLSSSSNTASGTTPGGYMSTRAAGLNATHQMDNN